MNTRIIDDLLEKYWNCETTEQEEKRIRRFFNEEDVPEHLARYKDLFAYQTEEAAHSLSDDFDKKILDIVRATETTGTTSAAAAINDAVKTKTRRISFFRPLAGIAVAVAIAAGCWFVYDTSRPRQEDMMADTFQTPEEALAEISQVFSFIGTKVDKGQAAVEKSIEKTEPIRTILEPFMN